MTTTGEPEKERGVRVKRLLEIFREANRRGLTGEERTRFLVESVAEDLDQVEADEPLPLEANPRLLAVDPVPFMQAFSELTYTSAPDAPERFNLVGEEVESYRVTTELVQKEQTRRGLMIGLTVGFAFVLLLQIGFAVLGGTLWERVGPILSTASTLIAAGFGYVWGHYFSGKD